MHGMQTVTARTWHPRLLDRSTEPKPQVGQSGVASSAIHAAENSTGVDMAGQTGLVRFTLTYRGPLPGRGTADQKHRVRQALHPQLKELWKHPPLVQNSATWLSPAPANDPGSGSALRRTGHHGFAVIVMQSFNLVAELDILLLRPEDPGSILQRADIDNRLKTLFDALRYPNNPQEVPKTWSPSHDEQPLFCLLDDDRLVTRVNVEADRLLDTTVGPDEVMLTIRVQLRALSPTWATVGLIG